MVYQVRPPPLPSLLALAPTLCAAPRLTLSSVLCGLQLLEEMLDEGYPLTTETNLLRDIVLPPSLLSKVLSAAGVSGCAGLCAHPEVEILRR